MNITVIGASAGVGLKAVDRALQRGHRVTTLSRSQIVLPPHPQLKSILGSATDRDCLIAAISGADAVIITLGTGKSTKATTLYSTAAKLLADVQQELRSQAPFIVLTGFGAGESGAHQSLLMGLLFKLLLKDVYADKSRMEQIIASSAMRWVIVRPGRLTNGPLTERYRVETRLFKGVGIGGVNRADVADYLVKQAEDPTELFKYPALSNH